MHCLITGISLILTIYMPTLAGGYGNEGVHYGEIVSFIRYFKFLFMSFPILTLMKDDGKNRVLETFSFFLFQFLKLNEEIEIPGKVV